MPLNPILSRLRLPPAWAPYLALALLYVLALNAYYVGFFNDDAFYLIGARSLLEGRYAELNAPGAPPLVNYLPGYPLLLAPVVRLFPSSLLAPQLLSVAMTLGAVYFCSRLASSLASEAALAAVLLAALNPLTVSLSGAVLSDIPYFLLAAALLDAGRRLWASEDARRWAELSLTASFAFWLRPSGLAFPLALVGALLLDRRWRLAALCAGICLPLTAAFPLRNRLVAGQALLYAAELSDAYMGRGPLAALGRAALENLSFYSRELFARALWRLPEAWRGGGLEALGVAASAALCALGALKGRGAPRGRFALLYLCVYSGAHLAWSKRSGRYLLGIFPLVFPYFFSGLDFLENRWRLKGLVRGALALCLALGLAPLSRVLDASLRRKTPLNTPPEIIFSWIRSRTEPDALFAAELDGRLHLHTGRPALRLPHLDDPLLLSRWLRERGVRYVLVLPTEGIMRTLSGSSRHDPLPEARLRELLARCGFEEAFSSPKEGASVHRAPGS